MRKPGKNYGKRRSDTARRVLMILIGVTVLTVAVNTVAVLVYDPVAVAKGKTEEIAREYYENYYYDSLDQSLMSKYERGGFPAISLRVLLTYDNAKNGALDAYYSRFDCNARRTEVVYYPVAPYGRKDYKLEINYSCNFQ